MSDRNKKEWWAWHHRNPHMQALFDQLTLYLISKGRKHYGASAVAAQMRWRAIVAGDDGFKVNNNHIPFMARMFHHNYKEHDGFYYTRENGGRVPHGAHEETEKLPSV